jgi:two-component system, LytTR family, sensor kinase
MVYFAFSGLVYYFGSGFGDGYNFIFVYIIDVFTVYWSIHFLLRRYLGSNQQIFKFALYYLITLFANFSLNFVLQNFIFGELCSDFMQCLGKQAYSLQFSMVFISMAIGIKMFQINREKSKQISQLEKSKVMTELDSLKNQINPHFLFNTLNNVYIQTRIEPKKAADMVLKLSDLLRYQLYECSEDKVLLKSEYEYLKNYVDLQQLRITNIDIKFEQKGSFKGLMIYPFMFIPFLENAFKYGVSSKGVENFIHIFVEIVEKYVIFAVKNSINDTIEHKRKEGQGGMTNVKRRLELLYEGKYELKTENRDNYFYVELKINLE